MTSMAKIFELLDEEPDIRDLPEACEDEICGNIGIRQRRFGYNDCRILRILSAAGSACYALRATARSPVSGNVVRNNQIVQSLPVPKFTDNPPPSFTGFNQEFRQKAR